jgi:hypothetical protein
MIVRRFARQFRLLLGIVDGTSILIALLIASYIRFGSIYSTDVFQTLPHYLFVIIVATLTWLLSNEPVLTHE